MENLLLVALLTIVGIIVIATIKNENKVFGICASIALGIVLVLYSWKDLTYITSAISSITSRLNADTMRHISLIAKISVVALIGEYIVSVCTDAGEHALGVKIQIVIKLMITALSIPILISLANVLISVVEEMMHV